MDNQQEKEAVKVYKALGELTRLKIVHLLSRHKQLSCTEIGDLIRLPMGSTLSHHNNKLEDTPEH